MYNLLLGDCLEHMESIPSGSVDCIITDPDYGLQKYSTGDMHFNWRSDIRNTVDTSAKEIEINAEVLSHHLPRIISPKGNIMIFCGYNQIGEYHKIFDPLFDTFQVVVWHKTNPTPQVRKSSFLNACEFIVCFWNKKHVWQFTRQNEMHNFIESGICQGNERIRIPGTNKSLHPTQKPLKVCHKLIGWATEPGMTIYDPFMGVASIGEAALLSGRNYVGVEINQLYYNVSKERLSSYKG